MKLINLKAILLLSKIKKTKIWTKVTFFFLGIASTIWFLARVIPKPSRASYPCMQAAAPWASGFVLYLLAISGSAFAFKKFRSKLKSSKYITAFAFLFGAFIMIMIANTNNRKELKASDLVSQSYFAANEPIGTASGLKPGRVVWIYNNSATNENFTPTNNVNNWWANHTNRSEVEKMLEQAVLSYTEESSVNASWDKLFKYFNEKHGKGLTGYTPGEKIYIKINITNSTSGGVRKTGDFDRMDATPEVVYSLLKQLIEEVGVAQSDICLGDPFRTFHDLYWNICHSKYPNVVYCDGRGTDGRHQTVPSANDEMFFSDKKYAYRIPQEYLDAEYFINMPCLKTHNEGAITLGAKNHQGSILPDGQASSDQLMMSLHYSLPANNKGYGKYRHLVDYLGHKDLGGKTLITIIDGIWAGRSWEGYVEKWKMTPFNNDYPSSLLLSQDLVAIDAVGFDFLLEEYKSKPSSQQYPYINGVDDYLMQAADPNNWADGITYDPENDGTPLKSLGVYEHWNNATDKQYSRNLKTGNGIELVKVDLSPITPGNSGLVSSKVNEILIDPFDVKWFGTDKGISRFDGINWITYDKTNQLRDNVINDLAYQKSNNEHSILVATNGGLSVMNINETGVKSTKTFYKGGAESGIISDTVTATGVDIINNRWISTPKGINIQGSNGWDTIYTYMDEQHEIKDWNGLIVNSIESYDKDTSVYLATTGTGVIRYKYDAVDGYTGASALSSTWSGIRSDTVSSLLIIDTIQWYATNYGVYEHFGPSTKSYWDYYLNPENGIISSIATDVEVDDLSNVWVGTDKGFNIITENGIYKHGTPIQTSGLYIIQDTDKISLNWNCGNGFSESIFSEKINDIQKDKSGNIWVASDNGVEKFNKIPGVDINETAKRVVFIIKDSKGTIAPVNYTSYKANPEFSKGTAIGKWYCVYNGTESSVNITGLSPNITYRAMAFEYFGDSGSENYNIAEAANNPINFTVSPLTNNVLKNSEMKAYPIPFNDFVVVRLSESDNDYEATIISLDGKVCKKISHVKNNQKINTTELQKGIYLLKVTDGENEAIQKIIK